MTRRQILQRWIWPQRRERLKAALILGLALMVVLAAVTLTGVQLAFALAPALVERVEQVAGDRLGADLSIGELDAQWIGWRPGLVLSDVQVRHRGDEDPGQPLSLESMILVISPWRSVQQQGFQLHALEASGLDVTAQRDADGTWQLAGLLPLPVQQSEVSFSRFVEALRGLPVDQLLLTDSRLLARDDSLGVEMAFDPMTLRWRRTSAGEWRFAADARAGEHRVRGRLQIPKGDTAATRGFIDLSGIHGRFLQGLPVPMALQPDEDARIDARLWLDFQPSGLARWRVEMLGDGLNLFGGSLDQVDAVAQWRRTPEGWQGSLHPRQLLDGHGHPQRLGDLALGREAGGPWRLRAEALPLSWLSWLPSGLGAEIAVGSVEGRVHGLEAVWQSASQWRVRGDIGNAGLSLPDQRLAVSGGRMSVELSPRGGELMLRSAAAEVGAPVLREPLAVAALSGSLVWWRGPGNEWRMAVSDASGKINQAPFTLSGHGWTTGMRAPFVDLNARLTGVDATEVLSHLPEAMMPPAAVQWLDQALVGGQVSDVSGRLAGPLGAFPFDGTEGVFDLVAKVENGQLAFHPDWPTLEALSGMLRFRNRSMEIEAQSGEIGGVRVDGATASVDNLQSPVLHIAGAASGPLAAMADTVLQSPLLDDEGQFSTLSWQGEGALDLFMELPMDGRAPAIEGNLQLTDAELVSSAPAVRLSELQGRLQFDHNGVQSDGLRAQWQGREVTARARTRGQGESARIRIDADTVGGLGDWPGMEALANFGQGQAGWRLHWQQPGFQALTRGQSVPGELVLRSDLSGIGIDAGLGLSKRSDEMVDLQVVWERALEGGRDLSIDYGDRLRIRDHRVARADRRIAIHFGSEAPPIPERNGLALTGSLPVLDRQVRALAAKAEWTPKAETDLPPVHWIDLETAGLHLGRWRLGPLRLSSRPESPGARFRLSGSADGDLHWQSDARHLSVDLETVDARVQPRPRLFGETPGAAPSPVNGIDVDLHAERLVLAGKPMGELSFRMHHGRSDRPRARLRISGEAGDLDAAVHRVADTGDRYQLQFHVDTGDAGYLLTGVGLAETMREGQGAFGGELLWNGSLFQPRRSTLEGHLDVDLRDGSLPAIEPGAGRALGLFSLSVLPRRLTLDFSDVVGEGFRFDALKGSWVGSQGQFFTDDLALRGPSLNVDLTGTTDTVEETHDQRVTVTPRVGPALGALGGLAGGPTAAVMLFLTRDVLGAGVDRASEIRYRIHGPWVDPNFEVINARASRPGAGNGNE